MVESPPFLNRIIALSGTRTRHPTIRGPGGNNRRTPQNGAEKSYSVLWIATKRARWIAHGLQSSHSLQKSGQGRASISPKSWIDAWQKHCCSRNQVRRIYGTHHTSAAVTKRRRSTSSESPADSRRRRWLRLRWHQHLCVRRRNLSLADRGQEDRPEFTQTGL